MWCLVDKCDVWSINVMSLSWYLFVILCILFILFILFVLCILFIIFILCMFFAVGKRRKKTARFSRIEPRLCIQIRLHAPRNLHKVSSKKDETEGVSCKNSASCRHGCSGTRPPFDGETPKPQPRGHLPPRVFRPRSCSSNPTWRWRHDTLRKHNNTTTTTRWRCPEAPVPPSRPGSSG